MPDFVDTMAYAGQTPWHGLGTYVGDQDVDSRTMIEAAQLDWKVEKVPAQFNYQGELRTATDRFIIIRKDTGLDLGACGKVWTPFQNRDGFAFLDSLKDEGTPLLYHTAGSLYEGRSVWILVQLQGQFDVVRIDGTRDPHVPFLLCSIGHDLRSPIVFRTCRERVVCANTLMMALREKDQVEFRIRHTVSAKAKVEAAREAIGLSVQSTEAFAQVGSELDRVPMGRDTFNSFAEQVVLGIEDSIGQAQESITKARDALSKRGNSRLDNQVAELEDAFYKGIGNKGQSRYDALNAVTEWVDHKRRKGKDAADQVRKDSQALDSAWNGSGAKRKALALRLLTR